MNKRQKKKLYKKSHEYYIPVYKKKPPKEKWILGNFSDGAKGYPIFIEKDNTIYYRTLYGRRKMNYDSLLLEWRYNV